MYFEISTTDEATAEGMFSSLLLRDAFDISQSTKYIGEWRLTGTAETMSGRTIALEIKFSNQSGFAKMIVDAPDSQGGFLRTILREIEKTMEGFVTPQMPKVKIVVDEEEVTIPFPIGGSDIWSYLPEHKTTQG